MKKTRAEKKTPQDISKNGNVAWEIVIWQKHYMSLVTLWVGRQTRLSSGDYGGYSGATNCLTSLRKIMIRQYYITTQQKDNMHGSQFNFKLQWLAQKQVRCIIRAYITYIWRRVWLVLRMQQNNSILQKKTWFSLLV